jgi:RNA polymerase sigma-70 factor (TIGR02960 family)
MSEQLRADFEQRVAPFQRELRAYCYRLLGSVHDADDALQEALLGAYRGLSEFEGRSSLRTWLYRIATHACLRAIAQRPKRLLSPDYAPATDGVSLDPMVQEPIWLEPYPLEVTSSYELRESVELAFVAALQHLPANQRAALVLRDVLGFEASEVAELLQASVPAVNSALQRARESVAARVPKSSQQHTLRALGPERERALVEAYVAAWDRQDVDALVRLLARDVRFSMPPIPSWFEGRDAVARFFRERVFATPWRLRPMRASGQLAFACHQGPAFSLGALNVITVRDDSIVDLCGFLDPAVHALFDLPDR